MVQRKRYITSVRMLDLNAIKKIHCLGIGGVGVCAIAELLLGHGFQVSGTDLKENANTRRLRERGARIYIGHDAGHVDDVDLVVYSTAVKADNPEMLHAQQLGIPLWQRAKMLAALMDYAEGIAVSGTHGKTTTTSLIAHILLTAGKDPSFAIGGELQGINEYAHLGEGDYFVAEADESDASFLQLSPKIAVVHNIEADHMATYADCFSQLTQTFGEFLQRLPVQGLAVLAADDPVVMSLRDQVSCQVVSYGFDAHADIRADDYNQHQLQSEFRLLTESIDETMVLNLPGKHNVQNALAAIAVALSIGIDVLVIKQALACFPGVGRRFFIHGNMMLRDGAALVIEDYGHHPSAIKVTLQAAKHAWPNRRVVLVFQPHRYTRTQDLFDEFVKSLAMADMLVLLDVYAAGEEEIACANGLALCEAINQQASRSPVFVPNVTELPEALQIVLRPDDVVILQGAGNIGALSKQLVVV